MLNRKFFMYSFTIIDYNLVFSSHLTKVWCHLPSSRELRGGTGPSNGQGNGSYFDLKILITVSTALYGNNTSFGQLTESLKSEDLSKHFRVIFRPETNKNRRLDVVNLSLQLTGVKFILLRPRL